MALFKKNQKIFYIFLLVVIVIGGWFFWASDLEYDPPLHYSGIGQSLSTDPHHYVYHARNSILFDDSDPFDYPRWTVFQHSLISLISYIIFSLTEVSFVNLALTNRRILAQPQ